MKILYHLLYALWYALSLLPMWVHYMLADVLYFLIYYIGRYRRKVVRSNLASSFPEKSEQELRDIERGFYHFFCDYIAETVKLLTISPKNLQRRMHFINAEQLDQIAAEGQPVGIYLGHYCNWEWVTSLPLWLSPEVQCGQIYHPIENKQIDKLFLNVRQRLGATCIPMNETLRDIVRYRNAGKTVVIGYISDQVPYWQNIHHWCDFLNHDTPVLTGAERILRKLNHAVFYLDMRRVRRGYYEGELKLITREPNALPEFGVTDAYFRLLEESIRRAPAFWLWSHNRWKRTREKFNNEFEVVNGKVLHKPTAP